LKEHTGKDLTQIQKDTDRDYFMSGIEARDYGIVDHVIRNREDLDTIDKAEK
jgi:ATP-dependent Clp protease protease subunit